MEKALSSPDVEPVDLRIAALLNMLRGERGWTLDELAGRSGVSRATLSRLENAEVSPTAVVLSRLCAAHGIPVSRLMQLAEAAFPALITRDEQMLLSDPRAEFERRSVSPPAAALSGEVAECRLGPGTRTEQETSRRPGLEHHLLLVFGRLSVALDGAAHALKPGDCLRYRASGPIAFETPADSAARYYLFTV